jgi:hypothetical protein
VCVSIIAGSVPQPISAKNSCFGLLFGVFFMVYIRRVDRVPQMLALVNIMCVLLDMIGIFFCIVSAAFCCFQTVSFK